MSETFTPGPWSIMEGTGFIVANDPYEKPPQKQLIVGEVRGWGRLQYLGAERSLAIQDANARLIAAAPELLAWVEKYRRCREAHWQDAYTNDEAAHIRAELDIIDALLGKVRGCGRRGDVE